MDDTTGLTWQDIREGNASSDSQIGVDASGNPIYQVPVSASTSSSSIPSWVWLLAIGAVAWFVLKED